MILDFIAKSISASDQVKDAVSKIAVELEREINKVREEVEATKRLSDTFGRIADMQTYGTTTSMCFSMGGATSGTAAIYPIGERGSSEKVIPYTNYEAATIARRRERGITRKNARYSGEDKWYEFQVEPDDFPEAQEARPDTRSELERAWSPSEFNRG